MIDAIHFMIRVVALLVGVGALEMFALVALDRVQTRRARRGAPRADLEVAATERPGRAPG